MLLTCDAIDTGCFAVGVLLLHVDLQRLLILVVPVALRTLQRLAGIVAGIPADRAARRHPARVEDQVTLGTFDSRRPALHVVGTSPDRGAL